MCGSLFRLGTRVKNAPRLNLVPLRSSRMARCRCSATSQPRSCSILDRGFDPVAEVLQLLGVDVAHRDEAQVGEAPAPDVEALQRFHGAALRRRSLRIGRGDEQVDDVLAPFVDDGGDRPAVEIIEPAADQRESLGRQVDHRRGQVDLAVEPGLDGVLIARRHVDQVVATQRAQMRRHRVPEDALIGLLANHHQDEARGQRRRHHTAGRKSLEQAAAAGGGSRSR